MRKHIGTVMDEQVWDTFKNYVMQKYGQLHTVLGQELEKALICYMESDLHNRECALTHVCEEEQKPSQKKIKESHMSPYHARLTTVQEKMKAVRGWDTQSFQEGLAIRYIKEICGGDPRTIKRYYSDLQTKWELEG